MIKLLGLSLYGNLAASTRYRLTQFSDGLLENSIQLEVQSLLTDDYISATYAGNKYSKLSLFNLYLKRIFFILRNQHKYDLAIVNAELFPLFPALLESKVLTIPYVYDFDDAYFHKYSHERFKFFSFFLKYKFNSFVANSTSVLAGNNYLANYANKYNPNTTVFPTVVDTNRYIVKKSLKNGSHFTIGWIGSPSTSVYLKLLKPCLEIISNQFPVRFVVVGGSFDPIPGLNVVCLPWSESTEVDIINTFDVGVMPLFDDPWSKGKCAFKLIQYLACGVPVIASPVGANIDIVSPECGFFASSTEEWINHFKYLITHPQERYNLGLAGRNRIINNYSLQNNLPVLIDSIKNAIK